jgi:hypothetical protein
MEWPANSPDLNPIENLWSSCKRKLNEKESPSSMKELWRRFEDVWSNISHEECKVLVESMPARMKAVINAKGGPIDY